MTQFGTFTIMPSTVGDSGVSEAVPATVEWPFHRNLVILIPWAFLVVLLLLKPNRSLSAWAVMIPLMSWALVLLILAHMLGGDGGDFMISIVYVIAMLWSLSYIFSKMSHNGSRFLAAVPILALAFAVYALGTADISFETLGYVIGNGLILGGMWFAFGLAGFIAFRRSYQPLSFALWLLLFCLLVSLGIIGPFALLLFILEGGGFLLLSLLSIVVVGVGVSMWLLLMSFMALVWFNREYRRRFAPIFGIPMAEMDAVPAVPTTPNVDIAESRP